MKISFISPFLFPSSPPSYKLRIECMLLKEEFAANMSYLEPSINSMILAGEDLMTNKPLQEVLYMVLVTGNFLNSVRNGKREDCPKSGKMGMNNGDKCRRVVTLGTLPE